MVEKRAQEQKVRIQEEISYWDVWLIMHSNSDNLKKNNKDNCYTDSINNNYDL